MPERLGSLHRENIVYGWSNKSSKGKAQFYSDFLVIPPGVARAGGRGVGIRAIRSSSASLLHRAVNLSQPPARAHTVIQLLISLRLFVLSRELFLLALFAPQPRGRVDRGFRSVNGSGQTVRIWDAMFFASLIWNWAEDTLMEKLSLVLLLRSEYD